ncbi:MAG: TadE/TadG family type IV pilus assembly protein [Christensenella sp.]|nr:TadE/TadG family type IV pilus assembly protein [Christensenella sp.]
MKQTIWNRRRESGQSLVELAITLPLVLLLICGMLEMGWLASTRQVMDTITREATRAGIVGTTTAASTAAVNSAVTSKKPSYMKNTITVTVTFSNPSSFKDGNITVTTAYDLPTLTPLTAFLAPGGSYHVVSTCTMKMG